MKRSTFLQGSGIKPLVQGTGQAFPRLAASHCREILLAQRGQCSQPSPSTSWSLSLAVTCMPLGIRASRSGTKPRRKAINQVSGCCSSCVAQQPKGGTSNRSSLPVALEQRQLAAEQHFLRAGAFGGRAKRGEGCSWPARGAVPSRFASLCLQLVAM